LKKEEKKEVKISSEKLYKNSFVDVFVDDIINVNLKKTTRFYILHKGSVGILPITKDGNILLIEQFRYSIQNNIVEVPAGLRDITSETSMEAVMREFREETGYFSDSIHYIGNFYPSIGYSNELIDLYIAEDCIEIENRLDGAQTEKIIVHKIPLQKVKIMLENLEIKDSKAIILLQHYFLSKQTK
jgi:ADP-ribose pyrophosphatase